MRSSRKIPNLIRPPLPDEFEVSLFGPGVGECVVVHLGSGEWMVVDSCTDRKTGNPVALDYLDQIGVNVSKAVKLIVITHWHNDHMRGLARILKAAASAELVCSAALKSIEFQDLLGASLADPPAEIGVDEFRGTFEVLLERGQGRAEAVGPKWAMANMCVFRSTQATVHALSPSHATFSLSLREIGASYQVSPRPRRRMVAQTANEVSVVLWVEFGDLRALLGADLENAKDKRTGWLAIVDSSDRPQGRAQLVKNPHHGSRNADQPRVWNEMLINHPYSVMTPFSGGSMPLPTESDCKRLASRTPHLYLTSPARGPKATGLAPPVEKLMRRVSPDLRDAEGPMGHVRWRMKSSLSPASVELFGRAQRVSV